MCNLYCVVPIFHAFFVVFFASIGGATGRSVGSQGASREPSGTQITILAFLEKSLHSENIVFFTFLANVRYCVGFISVFGLFIMLDKRKIIKPDRAAR